MKEIVRYVSAVASLNVRRGAAAAGRFFRREPVVVINGIAAVAAYGAELVASVEVAPGAGWGAVLWAVIVYVIRSQVSPAANP